MNLYSGFTRRKSSYAISWYFATGFPKDLEQWNDSKRSPNGITTTLTFTILTRTLSFESTG